MKTTASLLLALPLLLAAVSSHAQSAVDEHAIIATASALDAAIDDKDWERARELLLDEITVALPDEEPTTMPADALVARWQEELHFAKTTFHLRGGERVTFDGADSAVLRSKAQVSTHVDGIAGDDLHERWSDYHHELDRTENGWRVRHYGYVRRLESGNVAVVEHRLAAPPVENAGTGNTPDAPPEDAGGETGEGAIEGTADAGDTETGTGDDDAPPADDGVTPPEGATEAAPDESKPADGG